jgi:hypothetical protein
VNLPRTLEVAPDAMMTRGVTGAGVVGLLAKFGDSE